MRQTAIRTLLGFGLIFLALTPAKAADRSSVSSWLTFGCFRNSPSSCRT